MICVRYWRVLCALVLSVMRVSWLLCLCLLRVGCTVSIALCCYIKADKNKVYASQLAATNPRLANQLLVGICGLLTVVMGLRFKKTGKVRV